MVTHLDVVVDYMEIHFAVMEINAQKFRMLSVRLFRDMPMVRHWVDVKELASLCGIYVFLSLDMPRRRRHTRTCGVFTHMRRFGTSHIAHDTPGALSRTIYAAIRPVGDVVY